MKNWFCICLHLDIPTSRIPSRIDLSEIAFEKRISRRRNTSRHIADRNAFLRRLRSMYVSSDKCKPQRFATIPSRSAVLDFKPSRRVIVIALNLERRVVPRLLSSPIPHERHSPFFFPRARGEPNSARYRSGAASSTSGCHDDVPSGRRDDKKEKRGGKKTGTEARVEGLGERKCG